MAAHKYQPDDEVEVSNPDLHFNGQIGVVKSQRRERGRPFYVVRLRNDVTTYVSEASLVPAMAVMA